MADDKQGIGEQLEDIIDNIDVEDALDEIPDFDETGREPYFDGADEESEDQADDDAAEDEDAADDEPEDEEAEDGEDEVDPIAEFARTGNPNALPDGELKDRVLSLLRDYTQKSQQLSEAQRLLAQMLETKSAKGGEASDTDEDPMPKVDLDADEETIVKQIAEVARWSARQEARRIEREMAELKQHQMQQKQMDAVRELEDYVRSLDGYTPEIEEKMGQFMQQHADDPEWRQLFTTRAGLKLIFDNVRGVYEAASKQDAIAKRAAKAKKNSQPRVKSRPAKSMDARERFKGLSLDEKLNKAVQEALNNA